MFATVKRLWNKYRELIRYLIVGVLTTAVSLGVYWLATATVFDPADPVALQAANVLSWIAAVTFAYFANRIFVFQSKSGNVLKEAGAFFLSRVGTLLLDMAIMFVAVTLCLGMAVLLFSWLHSVLMYSTVTYFRPFVFLIRGAGGKRKRRIPPPLGEAGLRPEHSFSSVHFIISARDRKQILFSAPFYGFPHHKGKGGSDDQGRVAAHKGEICGFFKGQEALMQAGIRRQAQAGLSVPGHKVRKGLLSLQVFSFKQDI